MPKTSRSAAVGLWDYDGLIMAVINKNDRLRISPMLDNYFVPTREEAFFGWYNRGQWARHDGYGRAAFLELPPTASYSQSLRGPVRHDGSQPESTADGVRFRL